MSGTSIPLTLVICDKAPRDRWPVALRPGDPCPWCGKPQAEHRKETLGG